MDLFSRALRLRWLWFEWLSPDKPWVGTELPINTVDRQLFRESTVVTLGNGATTSFWQSSWMNGQAPMDLYLDLFKLAWRKNTRVKEEFLNQNWTRGLWRMETVSQMANIVELWDAVQQRKFNDEQDTIKWRWKADGS